MKLLFISQIGAIQKVMRTLDVPCTLTMASHIILSNENQEKVKEVRDLLDKAAAILQTVR